MINNFFQLLNPSFDKNTIQELKCSLLTGVAKIMIIQPFDFLRYRIQSSEYPVSIKKITMSLINKEGFSAILMGSPATSFGVFLSSLIHFTLYQYFQKVFILKEFDEDISNSLKNLEIFKLMELNHLACNNESHFDIYNVDFNDKQQDFIVKTDFINNYKLSGKLEKLKFERNSGGNKSFSNLENIFANGEKNLDKNNDKNNNYINNKNNFNKNGNKSDIQNSFSSLIETNENKYLNENTHNNKNTNKHSHNNPNNTNNTNNKIEKSIIRDFDYSAKCYEEHLSKILKICAFSGFLAGIGLAVITTPIDNVRIKMQSVQNIEILEKGKYRNSNTFACVENTYKTNGLRGFFKAFHFSLLREGIASTVYFTSYEYLKNKEKIKNRTTKIQFYKSFFFGAIAGGINWLITFPIDTVKTKLISDSVISNKNLYKNAFDCIKVNYAYSGLKGFYNGFSLVFCRGLIVNGVVLSSFDFCRARLISNN